MVLAAGREARDLIELGVRIADVVEGSQTDRGPRVSITAGIAECPTHGTKADELLGAAEEAAWAARAGGEVAVLAKQVPCKIPDGT